MISMDCQEEVTMQKIRQAAAEFLAGQRVAVTGVSRNRGGYSGTRAPCGYRLRTA